MKHLLAGLACIVCWSACTFDKPKNKILPVYGHREPVTKTVNGKTITDTIYQTIPEFQFVNQYGKTITNKSLDGSIYVADFFSTCPSICPPMHRNMLKVYNEFKGGNNVKFISHTIDPKHDSVAVLRDYADKLGIKGNTWWLLQGDKEATYNLAKSYLIAVKEDSQTPGGFIHGGYFVLIDKQKRIRGTYNGVDPNEVPKLIADIKTLQAEPENNIAQ